MTVSAVLIAVSIVGIGLVAGFFWGWAVSSVPGLARVPDRTYVATMQSVNRAILNPLFLAAFGGTVVVSGIAAIAAFWAGDTRRGWWMAAAAITYAIGVFAVTAAGNVPLNNELDRFDAARGTDADHAAARLAYERPWNRLHHIRSVLGVFALSFAAVAALTPAA